MVISFPLILRELAHNQQLCVQSFIYMISSVMCLKSGMVTIFKTPPWVFNQYPSIFLSKEWNKIATKMQKPILNQAYYGKMVTGQRRVIFT